MARHGRAIAGGVGVLMVTAWAAFWELAQPRATLAYRIAGIVLVVLLLVGAWLLARFIRRHGDEIGEARFDTRNRMTVTADFPLPRPPLGARGRRREDLMTESLHG